MQNRPITTIQDDSLAENKAPESHIAENVKRGHLHEADKSVGEKDKTLPKHFKSEENISPASIDSDKSKPPTLNPTPLKFSIDDFIHALNNFRKFDYEPYIFEFDAQLQKLAGVSFAQDIQSYKPTQIIPVDDVYMGRGRVLEGLGHVSLRLLFNKNDQVFYKASLANILNMFQKPDQEPKLSPLGAGAYVFTAVALKTSLGKIYLDVRLAGFTFQRSSAVEASGHKGLMDFKSLSTHEYYPVLPVKDRTPKARVQNETEENSNLPYLANISKNAPALCLAGEVYVQPEEATPKEIDNENPLDLFRLGTPQTGNYSDIQEFHGTQQEKLCRFLFGKGKHFVFFPFPTEELKDYEKKSPEYKNKLQQLKIEALDKAGFTYEDAPMLTSDNSSSTTNKIKP